MQDNGGEWMSRKRNPPAASNMGGVWERQIKASRKILESLLKTNGGSLSDESFQTVLVEIEAIVNSSPLMSPPATFSIPVIYSHNH